MSYFREFYLNNRRRVLSRIVKKQLDLSEISLISMNCIGGIMYHDTQQKFLSPTVNLFFTPKDFLKFVENLDYYLSIVPTVENGEKYPIGRLDDITLYFMHYNSAEEALSKWEERKKRVNKDKIFVIMVERDGFTQQDFEDFKKIKYPKLLFTRNKDYECDDSLYFSKYANQSQLPDIIPGRYMYSKMKIVKSIKKAFGI